MVSLRRRHAAASNPTSSLPSSRHPHRRPPRLPQPPHLTHHPQNEYTPRLTPRPTQSKRSPKSREKPTKSVIYLPPNKTPTHQRTAQHTRNKPMHNHQKEKTPRLRPTHPDPTQPDQTPYPHLQPTTMSLPPVRAVDAHRRAPASTTTRPPTPKNRCKIVTKSGQKKNYRPLLPDFSAIPAIPAIPAILPPKHVPPFHRTHNSCSSLVRPRMRPNPTTPTPKKEKTPRPGPTRP